MILNRYGKSRSEAEALGLEIELVYFSCTREFGLWTWELPHLSHHQSSNMTIFIHPHKWQQRNKQHSKNKTICKQAATVICPHPGVQPRARPAEPDQPLCASRPAAHASHQPDKRDRHQTDRRQTASSLNAPEWGTIIIMIHFFDNSLDNEILK